MVDVYSNGIVVDTIDQTQYMYKQFENGIVLTNKYNTDIYRYIKVYYKPNSSASRIWSTRYILLDSTHTIAEQIAANIAPLDSLIIDMNKSALLSYPTKAYISTKYNLLNNIKTDPHSLIDNLNFFNNTNIYNINSKCPIIDYAIPKFKINGKYLKYRSEPESDERISQIGSPASGAYVFNKQNDFGKSIIDFSLQNWGIVPTDKHKAIQIFDNFGDTDFNNVRINVDKQNKILTIYKNYDTDDEEEEQYYFSDGARLYAVVRIPVSDGVFMSKYPKTNYATPNGIISQPSIEYNRDVTWIKDMWDNTWGPQFRTFNGIAMLVGRRRYDDYGTENTHGSDILNCRIENNNSLLATQFLLSDVASDIYFTENLLTNLSPITDSNYKFLQAYFTTEVLKFERDYVINKTNTKSTGVIFTEYWGSWMIAGLNDSDHKQKEFNNHPLHLNFELKLPVLKKPSVKPKISQFSVSTNAYATDNKNNRKAAIRHEVEFLLPLGSWVGHCNWCEQVNTKYNKNAVQFNNDFKINTFPSASESPDSAMAYIGHRANNRGYGLALFIAYE